MEMLFCRGREVADKLFRGCSIVYYIVVLSVYYYFVFICFLEMFLDREVGFIFFMEKKDLLSLGIRVFGWECFG